MSLESSTSDKTLSFARSKDDLADSPETDILTLALDTVPSNRTRESLLDELMALKAMRDEGSQRGDSVSFKAGLIGDSELCCENIGDAELHAKSGQMNSRELGSSSSVVTATH